MPPLPRCRPAQAGAAAAVAHARLRRASAALAARPQQPPCALDVMLRAPRASGFQRATVLQLPARPGGRAPPPRTRAGGGPRAAELTTCCDCQRRFRRYVSDADWFRAKGLTPAVRCKQCRLYRQVARAAGDDPEALFPLADSALAYRELRNAYVARAEAAAAALAGARREVKAAKLLLAGGKTAYRREARRATLKVRRAGRKAARREEADAAAAAAAGGAAAAVPPPPPVPPPRSRAARDLRTPLQRLNRED